MTFCGLIYCLLNLSCALVLFANPAISASPSPITRKDIFLIASTIASSTSQLFTIKSDHQRPLKFPQRTVFPNSTSA